MVELSDRHACGLFNLSGIGKTLASQGIAAEETPPTLLQIEPARSCGNEEVMQTRMLSHPGPRLSTVMTGEVIGDDEDVPPGIVRFDLLKQSDVIGRVARGDTTGQFLAITHA